MTSLIKVIHKNDAIDWASVYRDFEALFIERNKEVWRREFYDDAIRAMLQIPIYKIGQIVPFVPDRSSGEVIEEMFWVDHMPPAIDT